MGFFFWRRAGSVQSAYVRRYDLQKLLHGTGKQHVVPQYGASTTLIKKNGQAHPVLDWTDLPGL